FFYRDTPATGLYTLSLHDALPILGDGVAGIVAIASAGAGVGVGGMSVADIPEGVGLGVIASAGAGAGDSADGLSVGLAAGEVSRSEEHTSELQSRRDLVCRLLLEK